MDENYYMYVGILVKMDCVIMAQHCTFVWKKRGWLPNFLGIEYWVLLKLVQFNPSGAEVRLFCESRVDNMATDR